MKSNNILTMVTLSLLFTACSDNKLKPTTNNINDSLKTEQQKVDQLKLDIQKLITGEQVDIASTLQKRLRRNDRRLRQESDFSVEVLQKLEELNTELMKVKNISKAKLLNIILNNEYKETTVAEALNYYHLNNAEMNKESLISTLYLLNLNLNLEEISTQEFSDFLEFSLNSIYHLNTFEKYNRRAVKIISPLVKKLTLTEKYKLIRSLVFKKIVFTNEDFSNTNLNSALTALLKEDKVVTGVYNKNFIENVKAQLADGENDYKLALNFFSLPSDYYNLDEEYDIDGKQNYLTKSYDVILENNNLYKNNVNNKLIVNLPKKSKFDLYRINVGNLVNLNYSTNRETYHKTLVNALNQYNNYEKFETIYKNSKKSLFKDQGDINDNSLSSGQITITKNYIPAGIYHLNRNTVISANNITFHPLALIVTNGYDINLNAQEIDGLKIISTPELKQKEADLRNLAIKRYIPEVETWTLAEYDSRLPFEDLCQQHDYVNGDQYNGRSSTVRVSNVSYRILTPSIEEYNERLIDLAFRIPIQQKTKNSGNILINTKVLKNSLLDSSAQVAANSSSAVSKEVIFGTDQEFIEYKTFKHFECHIYWTENRSPRHSSGNSIINEDENDIEKVYFYDLPEGPAGTPGKKGKIAIESDTMFETQTLNKDATPLVSTKNDIGNELESIFKEYLNYNCHSKKNNLCSHLENLYGDKRSKDRE